MKIFILILITAFCCNTLSQQSEEKLVTDTYFNVLETFSKAVPLIALSSLSDSELLSIAKKMYDAHQHYPKKTLETLWRNMKEVKTISDVALLTVQYGIKKEIKNRFGKEYYNVLESPYTFKIKVLDREIVYYYWGDHKFQSSKAVITAEIEYVLNGTEFNQGELIKFDFYAGKFSKFEIGEHYLVPLTYTYTKERKLAGLFLLDDRYSIHDNIIIDEDLSFMDNSELQWSELQQRYSKVINNIINGSIK